jgi:hypothetical protein
MVDFSHRSCFKERMTFNMLLCNLRSRSEGLNQKCGSGEVDQA